MDAAQALSDLTEVSSQINAALVLDVDGSTIASTLDGTRSEELARAAQELLAAVRAASGDGGKELAQLEVATGAGSVFLVRDQERTIAATTGPEPTVGLVFYDLKSCLRSLAAEEKPKPKPKPRRAVRKGTDDAEP
jgi:predicted regulator of Ras-like GTPase activity (Roadblock/LC7/MglB family)